MKIVPWTSFMYREKFLLRLVRRDSFSEGRFLISIFGGVDAMEGASAALVGGLPSGDWSEGGGLPLGGVVGEYHLRWPSCRIVNRHSKHTGLRNLPGLLPAVVKGCSCESGKDPRPASASWKLNCLPSSRSCVDLWNSGLMLTVDAMRRRRDVREEREGERNAAQFAVGYCSRLSCGSFYSWRLVGLRLVGLRLHVERC